MSEINAMFWRLLEHFNKGTTSNERVIMSLSAAEADSCSFRSC